MISARERLHYIGRRLFSARTGMRFISALFVLNVLVALLDYFLAGPGWDVVRWEARRRLTRGLGPARQYDIDIQATWADLLVGHVPSQIIHGQGVRTKDGLQIEALEIRMQGLTMHSQTMVALDGLQFRARIAEDALNAYVKKRVHIPLVGLLSLRLSQGEVQVFVGFKSLGRGTLSIDPGDDTRLRLDASHVAFSSRRFSVNVLDLENSPLAPIGIHFKEFRIVEHAIELAGIAVPRLPLSLKALEATRSPSRNGSSE